VLNQSICTSGNWSKSQFTYCDFSQADLANSDFSQSTWITCDRHAVKEHGTIWNGVKEKQVSGTDAELKAAQQWVTPV
jgi:uncharacterized protein YjbI with pentapeptide repeats